MAEDLHVFKGLLESSPIILLFTDAWDTALFLNLNYLQRSLTCVTAKCLSFRKDWGTLLSQDVLNVSLSAHEEQLVPGHLLIFLRKIYNAIGYNTGTKCWWSLEIKSAASYKTKDQTQKHSQHWIIRKIQWIFLEFGPLGCAIFLRSASQTLWKRQNSFHKWCMLIHCLLFFNILCIWKINSCIDEWPKHVKMYGNILNEKEMFVARF